MKAEITAALVKAKVTAPTRDEVVYDTREPGFLLRVRRSGAHAYAVAVGRGQWVTIGPAGTKAWSPDAARTEAGKIVQRIARGEAPTAKAAIKASVTLRAFLAEVYGPWLVAHRARADRKIREIRTAFPQLLDRPLAAIAPFDLERWRRDRLAGIGRPVVAPDAKGRKPKRAVTHATCNRELAELKALFSRAVTWGKAPTNPVKALKLTREDHSIIRFLSDAEEQRLRQALETRDTQAAEKRASANAWRAHRGYAPQPAIGAYADYLTPLVLLALNTGLRRGELLSLTWGAVDLVRGRVTVRAVHAKSGKARHVPLNTEARGVLTAWRPLTADAVALVFPRAAGGAGMTDIKTAWRGLMTAADITAFRFHDLRHTFASKLVMRGVDLNPGRERLGHADLKMTLRYAHLAPAHLDAAVETLVSA